MKYITGTKWASIKIANDNSVLVLFGHGDSSVLYFKSTDEFIECIKKRRFRAKHWVISVPDDLCVTKIIELPAEDIHQAYQMLEFELTTYLPLPANELVYGCVSLGKNEQSIKLMVHILKAKSLKDVLATFSSIGITPSRVMLDSIAVDCWFRQNSENDNKRINVILKKGKLFIYAAQNGICQKYEEIVLSNNTLESQKKDIVNVINQIEEDYFPDTQTLLRIAAERNDQIEARDLLETHSGGTEFLKPPRVVSSEKTTSYDNSCIVESIIVQGLSKAVEDPYYSCLNLLPRDRQKRIRQKQVVGMCAATGALSLLVVFCLWLNFATVNWRLHRSCQKIIKEITPIRHIAADVESKRQIIKAMQSQFENRKQTKEIFSQLYKYTPKQIALNHLSYSSQSETSAVGIKGKADTLSDAFEYPNAMKESDLLNKLQIINAQQIPGPGKSIVEFNAECRLKGSMKKWQ